MKNIMKGVIGIILLLFIGCSDDDGSPTTGGGTDTGGLTASANYNITFTTDFTEAEFPQDYPSNANFGTIVVITHSPEVSVYQLGQIASEGLRDYASSGDIDGLASFISADLGEAGDGLFTISTAGTAGVTDEVNTSVTFTPTRTRLTFLARLNPSPDWFLGVSSFDITNGNTLIDNASFNLGPIDAGVVAGTTYTASEGTESLAIANYTGAPFSDGSAPFVSPLGLLEITRQSQN